MKKFIILVFGFEAYQVNFVTVRPGESVYSLSYVCEFAYRFDCYFDALRAIDFLKTRYRGLRFEIVETNCLNFEDK